MEPLELKKQNIMHCLSCLPRKILKLHGRHNISEFVIHELGKKECFDFDRAAYIIDNPDFNWLKGVAGLYQDEIYHPQKDLWVEIDEFTTHMEASPYNQQVRSFSKPSCVRNGDSDDQVVKKFAGELGFTNPSFYAWPMKHDNHGILLYEKIDEESCDCSYLLEGLSLLGFCPVY